MSRSKETMLAIAERMAHEIAKGATQSDAYRTARPKIRGKPATYIAECASRFVAKHNVNAIAAEIRKEMRLQDIYSASQWMHDAISMRDAAIQAGNHNAAQALQRQLGQASGAIGQDQTTLVVAEKLTDTAIIARLAGTNPELARALAETMGADLSSATQDVVSTGTSGRVVKLTR